MVGCWVVVVAVGDVFSIASSVARREGGGSLGARGS